MYGVNGTLNFNIQHRLSGECQKKECICFHEIITIFPVSVCFPFLFSCLAHPSPPVPGWQSIQGAFDQVPDATPISDGGAVHDGGYAQRPPVEPHVHGQTLAALSSGPFSLFIDTFAIKTAFCRLSNRL